MKIVVFLHFFLIKFFSHNSPRTDLYWAMQMNVKLGKPQDIGDFPVARRSFHNLAPLYEKHFRPKADLRSGTAKVFNESCQKTNSN